MVPRIPWGQNRRQARPTALEARGFPGQLDCMNWGFSQAAGVQTTKEDRKEGLAANFQGDLMKRALPTPIL